MTKRRLIAFSARHGKPVIQTGNLADMDRIIREGEYDRSDLTMVECFGEMNAWHWTPEQIRTGAQLFELNRLTWSA